MERHIIEEMKKWKSSADRKPLIIEGMRQCGKTWAMKEFGRREFLKTAYINFDRNERMRALFEGSIAPERLLPALRVESGVDIRANDTLMIFDEVQEVPRALSSLKYFCEDAREYAIVAAGSQMGVALHSGTSFPVGKVDRLRLFPMNFREFLMALGDGRLADLAASGDFEMANVFRERYIDRLKQYFYIGGMPEAVQKFADSGDFSAARKIQEDLLEFYSQDFSKHAPNELVPRLNLVWNSIPSQLAKENRKFIYGAVRSGARAKDFELAIEWLSDCFLINKVTRITKPDVPLKFYEDFSSFKIYLPDTGLLCAASGIDAKTMLEGSDIFEEFKGVLTEQYVLQQLVSDCRITPYYYTEEKSSGEIDFVVQKGGDVVPIEVKAAENLQAKSLKCYHKKYENPLSIRTSLSNYRKDGWLTNIPLWAICGIK